MSLYDTGKKNTNVSMTHHALLEEPTDLDVLRLSDNNDDRFYASSAGLCYRKTAYEKLAVEDTRQRDTTSELYFKIGSAVEDVVAQRFIDKGVLLDRELRVDEPLLNLSGRIDFVINFRNEIQLVELKTCGRLPTSPRKGHAAQLLIYMALTGINNGLVWYVSRNVADFHNGLLHAPLVVTPTEKSLRAVLLNVAIGREYAAQGSIPDKPSYMKKSHCGFCSLQNVCWDGDTLPFPSDVDDAYGITQRANDVVDEIMAKRQERAEEMVRFYC